ncbi:acyl carrier protein [Pirellula sp. SH-Sr6A]|uniref:phosphopantetheine-binding protein n=1 Tax=Pirellula sp. SH-Sr6A TaxID=1632865 RepID=UPI00078BAC4D|nr:phosphopantetheine-binding protein [Pirellula sp. SH-Sr6A]AMV31849.1 acyl carrier protein [Pirellula sp. SH-Sr6A]
MTPNAQILHNKINEVLEESGRERVAELTPLARLKQDLDLDSLDLAVLTVKIEAATGIDIFADGLVETVGEILAKMQR